MLERPYVSGPFDHYDERCMHAIDPADPRPRCEGAATLHIAFLAEDFVSLCATAACDEHAPVALEAAGERFVQQHRHEALCAWPGCVWDFEGNRCVLDDSGVPRPVRAAEVVSA